MNHEKYMQQAIAAGVNSAATGGGPFGAVLVASTGEAVFVDSNHVTEQNDPTAHAEVSVIRQASAALGTFDLSGFVLYSSCEPCPMCLGAALWARVDAVFFAADRHDAAEAGFDDNAFYQKLAAGGAATALHMPNATAPFQAWAENERRTEY